MSRFNYVSMETHFLHRILFPLSGRDDHGRKVMYISTGGYDPNETSLDDVFRIGFMSIDALIQNEDTQVRERLEIQSGVDSELWSERRRNLKTRQNLKPGVEDM